MYYYLPAFESFRIIMSLGRKNFSAQEAKPNKKL
jgi:hypothetical protein